MNEAIRLTRHAREVMAARGVTFDEIAEVLARPEIVEPHQGKRRFVRDGVVVVVAEGHRGEKVVVTVLFRRSEQWTSEDMRRR